eukprot:COSAG05_NODE_9198_length_640_cov_1.500924_1_plen_70_part_10
MRRDPQENHLLIPGGKSSGLTIVAAHLRKLGWTVVVCPVNAIETVGDFWPKKNFGSTSKRGRGKGTSSVK